jgi:hypothetical protein
LVSRVEDDQLDRCGLSRACRPITTLSFRHRRRYRCRTRTNCHRRPGTKRRSPLLGPAESTQQRLTEHVAGPFWVLQLFPRLVGFDHSRRNRIGGTGANVACLRRSTAISFFFNQRAELAFSEAGKFTRAHAENLVACRPATLLASAIWSRESEPKYVWA